MFRNVFIVLVPIVVIGMIVTFISLADTRYDQLMIVLIPIAIMAAIFTTAIRLCIKDLNAEARP
jgi:hypothetical protein